MSRTIKAIERHMTLPIQSKTRRGELGLPPHDPKFVAEWQRGLETVTGFAQRKLRLAFAPAQSAALGKA